MSLSPPDAWQALPVATIAKPRLGGNYPNTSTPTGRPLIKMGNIARVGMDLTRLEFIPDGVQVDPAHRLRDGDVLFNTRNTLDLVGKVSIWRSELPVAFYNSNILRLEFSDEYRSESTYFGYALNSKQSVEAIRALATGTTSVAAVYTRDLLKLEVLVPPREERAKVAEVLTDADRLVSALGRVISKKRSIKQGLMQRLLTGEVRLPRFTRPWVDVSAGDIATFKGGSGFPLRYQGSRSGRYPFFKVSDMNDPGNGLFMRTARHYISGEQCKKMAAIVMPEGAIVFAKVGGAVFLERKRILSQPSCIDNNMAAMMLDSSRADVRFVHYLLTNFNMSSLVSTTALPSLNGGQLRSIPLPLPTDLAEQRAIAAVLADADSELEILGSRLTKMKAVRRGLMQELLTGRTRMTSAEGVS